MTYAIIEFAGKQFKVKPEDNWLSQAILVSQQIK
jgi:ribosomal protein L21